MMLIGPPLGLADRSQAVVLLALGAVVATIAVANSPAVVIAILTETHARGVMAQTALATTVCKDLALVVLFAVTMTVAGATLARAGLLTPAGEAHVAGVAEEAESHPAEENVEAEGVGAHADVPLWLTLVQHLGGSLLAGVVVGLGMAWYLHNIHEHLPIFLVLSCFGIALVSQALGLEALIVAIVAGMLMQNAWAERSQGFFEAVEDLSLPVYCVFFAVAGAKVDLAVAATMWPWALTLVGVRLFVVWGSTTLGATLAGVERPARAWLWTALVPQAGVSLALATIVAASIKGEHGEILFNLLLTMIAIHELAGPLLFKHGLVKAGEVEANGQTRE
jgi:Kef-type K+ transport system membrane component KefB